MIRLISLFGMTGGFLIISPPLRGSLLNELARAVFVLDQHSPYSYIALAVAVGVGAVWSLASPKPK
jgi:hypothetical protein